MAKSCDPPITGKHDLPSDTHIIDMQSPEAMEGINLREAHLGQEQTLPQQDQGKKPYWSNILCGES